MKKIMILGASILQLPAIEKAQELGLQVIAVDRDPNAMGFQVDDVVPEVISTIDTPRILEAAEKHNIQGIMTIASDMPMKSVAAVCNKMGLVGITEETACKATNKYVMRNALKDAGIPVPSFRLVTGWDEFDHAVKQLLQSSVSCIAKPTENSGSRGVVLMTEHSDMAASFEYVKENSRNGEIIVEEYMRGPEVSVETLAVNGKVTIVQITDKITTGQPHFVELGHSQPSSLSYEIQQQIRDITVAANEAIGIKDGPSHTEIIVTEKGPKIVELGARLGGDCISSHLVPLSTGIDMVECCIRIAMGEKPAITRKWNKGAAIRYIQTEIGEIGGIKGIDQAKNMPGVEKIEIVHHVGERMDVLRSSVDRIGFVIAQGKNAEEAVDRAEKSRDMIEVTIKK